LQAVAAGAALVAAGVGLDVDPEDISGS